MYLDVMPISGLLHTLHHEIFKIGIKLGDVVAHTLIRWVQNRHKTLDWQTTERFHALSI